MSPRSPLSVSPPLPHPRVPSAPCGAAQILELVTVFKGEVVDIAEGSLTVEVR